jgi:hypothetical protein
MLYVTSIERFGREEGRPQSRQEGILAVLETRFGDIPCDLREETHSLRDHTTLQRALRTAIVAASLAAFQDQLQAARRSTEGKHLRISAFRFSLDVVSPLTSREP